MSSSSNSHRSTNSRGSARERTLGMRNKALYESLRKRRSRRSKYDVSRIFQRQAGQNQLSGNGTPLYLVDQLAADPSLNLRRQKDRTVFTDEQMLILEAAYQKEKHPDPERRGLVAELCGLSVERVRIWYQNRRAKEKRVDEDELASLARRFYEQRKSSQSSRQYNSLASLNRKINRIFDKDSSEEDIIKKIMKQDVTSFKTESHSSQQEDMNDQKEDPWKHFRTPAIFNIESEESIVKKLMKRDNMHTENKHGRRLHSRKTSNHGGKRRRVEYQETEVQRPSSRKRARRKTSNSSFNAFSSEDVKQEGLPNFSCFSEANISNGYYSEKVLNEGFWGQQSSLPTPACYEELIKKQRMYLLHLMNQKNVMDDYTAGMNDGHLSSLMPQDQVHTPLWMAPNQQANNNLSDVHHNSANMPNKIYNLSDSQQPISWLDLLNGVDVPLLVDPYQRFNAFNLQQEMTNESNGQKTPKTIMPKFTQENAREYEIVQKIYEEEIRMQKNV